MNLKDKLNKELKGNYHTHNGIDSPFVKNPMFNLSKKAVQAGITANTGSTQATGTQITKEVVEISVCANAGDSVRLPFAVQGLQILITNHGVASCDVFSNSGDTINEGTVDTAKALAVNDSMLCSAYDNDNWECLILSR